MGKEEQIFPPIRYSQSDDPFFDTLRLRVDDYFENNGLSRFATPAMVGKTLFLTFLAILLYASILSNFFTGWALILLMVGFNFTLFLMSVGIAHDGSHQAYSPKRSVNVAMTRVFDLIGINSYLWDFNHIKSHHRAPNIPLFDSAIHSIPLFRWHPLAQQSRIHHYQHYYMVVIYACSTLFKLFFHDFYSFSRNRIGYISIKKHRPQELVWLLLSKAIVITYTLILPLALLDAPVWQILLGFLLGHFVAGLALGIIFMVTHICDHSIWPEPDENGNINATFARHIMATTSDFCPRNRVITWISGGLNIHVAHHLFPGICQIHLPRIAQIVEETAIEFNVPYKVYPSLWSALKSHFFTLKKLGEGSIQTKIELSN